METVTSWAAGEPVRSPFALPGGLAGRFAGSLMLRMNRQHAVLELLDVQPGTRRALTALAAR